MINAEEQSSGVVLAQAPNNSCLKPNISKYAPKRTKEQRATDARYAFNLRLFNADLTISDIQERVNQHLRDIGADYQLGWNTVRDDIIWEKATWDSPDRQDREQRVKEHIADARQQIEYIDKLLDQGFYEEVTDIYDEKVTKNGDVIPTNGKRTTKRPIKRAELLAERRRWVEIIIKLGGDFAPTKSELTGKDGKPFFTWEQLVAIAVKPTASNV